jgi:hypothetical protein
MDSIIVSIETRAGGDKCNEIRASKGMNPMHIESIDLVSEGGEVGAAVAVENKMSSSALRRAAVGTMLDGQRLFCRKSPANRPYAIGVTGGIACGKSLVVRMLSEMHPAEVEVGCSVHHSTFLPVAKGSGVATLMASV